MTMNQHHCASYQFPEIPITAHFLSFIVYIHKNKLQFSNQIDFIVNLCTVVQVNSITSFMYTWRPKRYIMSKNEHNWLNQTGIKYSERKPKSRSAPKNPLCLRNPVYPSPSNNKPKFSPAIEIPAASTLFTDLLCRMGPSINDVVN